MHSSPPSPRKRLPVPAILGIALAGAPITSTFAQEVLLRLDEDAGFFGIGLHDAGDVNADGIPDLIVGAFFADPGGRDSGEATVFSGTDGSELYRMAGDAAGDWFGRSVDGVGDLDGDGHAEFIIGAPQSDHGGFDSGLVRVYNGLDGSVRHEFTGAAGDHLGWRVAGLGDVDRDGTLDFAFSAHDHLTRTERDAIFVHSGADGHQLFVFRGEHDGHTLGVDLADVGDLNLDGHSDVLVGAAFDDRAGTDAGSVRVYSGADGSVLYERLGEAAGDRFGLDLDGPGDVNADGWPDLLVGANGSDANGADSGKCIVISGQDGAVLHEFVGEAASAGMGNCSGAGDVNGDGHADVAIGSSGTQRGNLILISGFTGDLLYRFEGEATGDSLGRTLSAAGDVDGDGLGDFLVSAPRASSGSVFLIAGNDLYLRARKTDVSVGDTLRLDTRGALPGAPAALFVTELDGAPLFWRVALGRLNASGNWRFTATVPPALAGSTIGLTSGSIGWSGAVSLSAQETVRVQ